MKTLRCSLALIHWVIIRAPIQNDVGQCFTEGWVGFMIHIQIIGARHIFQLPIAAMKKAGYQLSFSCLSDAPPNMKNIAPDLIILLLDQSNENQLAQFYQHNVEQRDTALVVVARQDDHPLIIKALRSDVEDVICAPVHQDVFLARLEATLRTLRYRQNMIQKNHVLRKLATQDTLTQCNNRRHFLYLSKAELAKSNRYKQPLSFLMLDADFFKRINDTYGHAAGDHVLRELASRCTQVTRESDIIGRLGGEEFAICCPHTQLQGAWMLAERIRLACKQAPIIYKQQAISLTVSIGITAAQPAEIQLDEILNRADDLMYNAKRNGRDQCLLATSEARAASYDTSNLMKPLMTGND